MSYNRNDTVGWVVILPKPIIEPDLSSQGYYFASLNAWPAPGTVTIGGKTYKVAIIDVWLSSVAKLFPTYLPSQTTVETTLYGNAKDATDWIGDRINAHHCE